MRREIYVVKFRGEDVDVVIDEVNEHRIEWHFDGLTFEEQNDLHLTTDEEADIVNQLQARDRA